MPRKSGLQYIDLSSYKSIHFGFLADGLASLEHVDVNGCDQLKTLKFYSKRLSFLDVRNCTQLQALFCSGNKLTYLDLSGCDSLRKLYCSKNRLSTLNAKQCASLTEIEAQDNALPLSECYALPSCNKRELNHQDIVTNCSLNKELDLQGEMHFNGYKTRISARVHNGNEWEDAKVGQDYTLTDSSVIFLKSGSFKVRLENNAVRNAVVYYHVTVPNKVETPRFAPTQDTVLPGRKISIFCSTAQSSIYYTLDGSEPTENALLYEHSIELTESTTIKAIAVKHNWENSQVVTKSYVVVELNEDDDEDEGNVSNITKHLQSGLHVYPNPCGDILHVKTDIENCQEQILQTFRILNLQGQEQFCTPGSAQQIDMRRLPSEIYLLEAIGANGETIRYKIIKQ